MTIKRIMLLWICVAAAGVCLMTSCGRKADLYEEDGMKYMSKTGGRDFYVWADGVWQKKFLKGVNIGTARPGYFPGELAITKEEYLRWFGYIGAMNAEVIRVYTAMMPVFYDALAAYNRKADRPLYLMQGVWVSEEDIAELKDAYADGGRIAGSFIRDAEEIADILHGNAVIPEKAGCAGGTYKSDVSPYVIGWILGIEWDPDFVAGTDANNPGRVSYSGSFLYTENASPFEVFLCEVGDSVLAYEASAYGMTRALSFANWPTTDMLDHTGEPDAYEDMVSVNTEHIKALDSFKSGVFASYNVYPYYPDFLSYQSDYVRFRDGDGSVDTYKAYLRDLIGQHTVPVLIAEFGVPSSRGKAHESLYSGYNQGYISETAQGEIDADLLRDIFDEGCCGGLVFAWQDEWFKRTWNTKFLDLPDRRPYWSNPQTNEQQFGLLAFDPGEKESVCTVDGDTEDWSGSEPVCTSDGAVLYIKSDEKYVYLLAETEHFDFVADTLYIPVDTLEGQGNDTDRKSGVSFSRAADFLIQISGESNSRITVDAYYDSFYYTYAEQQGQIEKNPAYAVKNSGLFNSMSLCLSKELFLPESGITVPFSGYETGLLTCGDANPDHEQYNSLADFICKDGCIEIRIPWQLLNVMDPSTKEIMGDLYANRSVKAQKTEGMYFGIGTGGKIGMSFYTWQSWDMPSCHERLKPSYYILRDAFAAIK